MPALHAARWLALPVLIGAIVMPALAQDIRLDRPGMAPSRLRVLCHEQAHPDVDSRKLTLAAERDSITRHTAQATTLDAATCTAALLYADTHSSSREDSHDSWVSLNEALNQAMVVLDFDPSDPLALEAFGIEALELEQGSQQLSSIDRSRTIAAAAYAGVHFGSRVPTGIRTCVDYSIVLGDIATARYCGQVALDAGIDSSWHLIRRAWIATINGDSAAATEFDRALRAAHDSAASDDAAWYAFWLRDSTTRTPGSIAVAWRGLSDSARVEWVHAHLPAVSGPESGRYLAVVVAALSNPLVHGPLYQRCPLQLVRNGFRESPEPNACAANGFLFDVNAQLVRLWDPSTGAPMTLVGYAVQRRTTLSLEASSIGRKATATFAVRQWGEDIHLWRDSVTERALRIPDNHVGDFATGVMRVPTLRGSESWTLWVSQGARSGAWSYDRLPAIGAGPLVLSDLVLGTREQNLSVMVGTDTVFLAPLGTVRHAKQLELFFQVRADSMAEAISTTLTLRSIVRGIVGSDAELSLTTTGTLTAGMNTVQRIIDLSRIGAGNHQLEVRLTNASGALVASRSANLLVR